MIGGYLAPMASYQKDLSRRFRRSEWAIATPNARFELFLPVRCRVTRLQVQEQIYVVCG
jgi:hypothetical protein